MFPQTKYCAEKKSLSFSPLAVKRETSCISKKAQSLLMTDESAQGCKIYILEWLKVMAVLKPANQAQINLSTEGLVWATLLMKWFRPTDALERKSMGGVSEKKGRGCCSHMTYD